MRLSLSLFSLVLTVVLSTCTSPTHAAPLPRKGGLELEKYLPDDTDFVLVINVKNMIESPAFNKHYKPLANTMLVRPEVKPFLEGSGIDPLKDIERVVIYIGRSCWGKKPSESTGPMFLIQGNFNATKVHAKAAELSKRFAGQLNRNKVGSTTVYEIKGFPSRKASSYAALLDSHTIYWGVGKEKLDQTLARARGKKKTNLKSKQFAKLLKDLDPKATVEAIATGTMVYRARAQGTFEADGDEAKFTFKVHTLADVGIHQLHGLVTVKDDIRGRIVFGGKDRAGNEKVAALINKGVEEMKREVSTLRGESLPPGLSKETAEHFIAAIESVTVRRTKNGTTVTFRSHPGALMIVPRMIFGFGTAAKRPKPVPAPKGN